MEDAVVSKEGPVNRMFGLKRRGRQKKEVLIPEPPVPQPMPQQQVNTQIQPPMPQPIAPQVIGQPVQQPQISQQQQPELTPRDVILAFGNELEELRIDYIRLIGYLEGKRII